MAFSLRMIPVVVFAALPVLAMAQDVPKAQPVEDIPTARPVPKAEPVDAPPSST